ncbi:hypothetical protein FB451DRAFT_1413116 [Mycena latifolia]|nr:hypothetical protein FB451DRAFT_1413116 [Mycena latifolia]
MFLSAGHALCPPSAFRTLARSVGRVETPNSVLVVVFAIVAAVLGPRTHAGPTQSTPLIAFAVPAHGAGHCIRRAALHRPRRRTSMRRYSKPWVHRSSSAPVTARITPLHGAVTRHFIDMNTLAACFFIPVGVVVYTLVGGLRATFSDYIHAVLIFAIILTVSFCTFATNEHLGSPSEVYALLQTAAANYPVGDAAGGLYTTMLSTDLYLASWLWFPVASKASISVKGYILGGFAFLPSILRLQALPFWADPYIQFPGCSPRAARLAMISLSAAPSSPFMAISLAQSASVAPAAMSALLGKSGDILLLIVLFLAVTSAASAELVAVSIITYDVYKRYITPNATDKQILKVSHVGVIGFSIFMGTLALFFMRFSRLASSLSVMPSAPGAQTNMAVSPSLLIGFICGIAAWFEGFGGSVDVATTGGVYEQLAGTAGSFFIAAIISMIATFIWPDDFDFEITRRMNAFQPEDADAMGHVAKQFDEAQIGNPFMTLIVITLASYHFAPPRSHMPAGRRDTKVKREHVKASRKRYGARSLAFT